MEHSDPRTLLVSVANILEQLGLRYLVTGGMAVFIWGRPRFTADIDIVVEIAESDIGKLEAALKALGKAGYVDADAMREAVREHGEFNFVDGSSGVKVDFWAMQPDAFDQSRLDRRAAKKILGRNVYFSSAEDLLLMKLRWYRQSGSMRNMEDARSIVDISGDALDWRYIEAWAAKLGVANELGKLREKNF